MITSDWHTHTTASPDGTLTVETLCEEARRQGLRVIGMSDHCNFNDAKYRQVMRDSRAAYERHCTQYPELRFGVELSPYSRTVYDALARGDTLGSCRAGYIAAGEPPYTPAFALTREDVDALGLSYVIAGVHWRCDAPDASVPPRSADAWIKEWLRLMTWSVEALAEIAGDRLKILAHPWYSCIRAPWVQSPGEDNRGFARIPFSAHDELAAALLQYGVAAECNADQVTHPTLSERYRREYAEFLVFLYERGVPITYGTDEHECYPDRRESVLVALRQSGYRENTLYGG